jgi:hypothetical protein
MDVDVYEGEGLATFEGLDFFKINPIIMNAIDTVAAVRKIRLNVLLDGNNEHYCSLQIVFDSSVNINYLSLVLLPFQ